MNWKMECHLHTAYSADSGLSLQDIMLRCKTDNIQAVAVTDHNTIKGAVALAKIAPFTVVVGEEIKTKQGEVIGYFLQEEIPAGLEIQETVKRIKAQNGLVCVPHPFDRLRKSAITKEALLSICQEVDIIEVFNARNVYATDNELAYQFACEQGKVMVVGSDSHTGPEIGTSHINITPFSNKKEFIDHLSSAELTCHKSSLFVHVHTKLFKWQRKFTSGFSK